MHAMACMDMDYYYYLKGVQATIKYTGMGNISNGRVQTNKSFWRIK